MKIQNGTDLWEDNSDNPVVANLQVECNSENYSLSLTDELSAHLVIHSLRLLKDTKIAQDSFKDLVKFEVNGVYCSYPIIHKSVLFSEKAIRSYRHGLLLENPR